MIHTTLYLDEIPSDHIILRWVKHMSFDSCLSAFVSRYHILYIDQVCTSEGNYLVAMGYIENKVVNLS